MNAKTMKAVLEHLDAKTTGICALTAKVRQYEDKFQAWKDIAGCRSASNGDSFEEFIRGLVADRKRMQITERDHIELCSALDEVPLPKDDPESYAAYALRVGDAMRALKDDKSTLQKDLHEARLEHSNDQSITSGLQQHVLNRDAQIAQLEEAASSLASALTLLGPMHDGELANEFVSRMADEKKRFTLQLDLIAKVIEQLPDSMRMKHGETYETCLRRIQKSHVALDEKCCAQQASIESLKNRDAELLALYDVIESLPGFPMQPPETYAEYLQRLAADRKSLKLYNEDGSRALADERSKNQMLTDQLQNTCSNEELSEALRERDQARRELEEEKTQLQTHKTLLLNAITMRDAALKERDDALLSIEQATANGRD